MPARPTPLRVVHEAGHARDERAQIVGELRHRARGLAQHGLGVLADLAARDHLARPRPRLALDLLLAAPLAVVVLVVARVVVIVFGGRHRRQSTERLVGSAWFARGPCTDRV